jgi:hypothetical protein
MRITPPRRKVSGTNIHCETVALVYNISHDTGIADETRRLRAHPDFSPIHKAFAHLDITGRHKTSIIRIDDFHFFSFSYY